MTAIAMLLALGMASSQVPPTTRVLVLYSHLPEGPAISAFGRQLDARIGAGSPKPVEFYREFLDPDRLTARERWSSLARYFGYKYEDFRIDVIIAEGSAALEFATEQLRPRFPAVPIVFTIAIEPVPDLAALPPNVTGLVTPLPFAATMQLARRLQPDARRVVVVSGTAPRDSTILAAALRDVRPFVRSLPITIAPDMDYEGMLNYLHRLPPKTIVLLPFYRRDARGRSVIPGEAISRITSASSAPVYGVMGSWFGQGIVGGSLISFEAEGVRTADLVLKVLRRAPGVPLPPPERGASVLGVDWRQLRRWGLSEARLPPGTQVSFREPTLWERRHAVILVSLGLVVAEALLIALLLLERERRMRAQSAVQDQMAYEQTMAALTTDALYHGPDDPVSALAGVLACVGEYAGASRAVLVQYAKEPDDMMHVVWSASDATTMANGAPFPSSGESRLEIPLVADGLTLGRIELYSADVRLRWSATLTDRLAAFGELIAGGIVRRREACSMQRSEELNRAVLASISAQIAIVDHEGMIIRVNDAWRQIADGAQVSAEHDSFVGKSYLQECRRAEDRGCREAGDVRRGVESVLESREVAFRFEYHDTLPEARWYELRVDQLNHGARGAILTHLDITEQRLAELRAEETRRQIAHMGRVAMVGELAAAVSHDVRQPLMAIRANAEAGAILTARAPRAHPETREIFRAIVDDTLRAADVIDHIRLLLRKGEQSVEVVDLNEICQQAATLLQRDAGLRQARLEIQLEPEGLPVTGDGVQLQQVVINLALNALDAAAHSDGERLVMISTRVAGGTAEVLVRDTGPGFEPKVKDHLFEPFFSTKSQGLGMGLAIVRSILERHKGRIRADNHPSGGALFRVTLPLAASDRELPMADSFALASKLTVEAGERQANGSPAWMRT